MESWLFLLLILMIAIIAKNNSLIIATAVVLVIKLFPLSKKIFPILSTKGINFGVIIITISILIPIATGQIGIKDLFTIFKSPLGWIAIFCGVLVAVLSSKGVGLIASDPQVTVALVFGTIIGVVFFRGVAAGPIIASGITYCLIQFIQFIVK
ncbi:DUF441 domain-containing protein [Melissococcus plutonius]|nr:DUF441 domain-containing protein [Melissococcus plutonius]MCV2498177.1 DUF441 domain-containing protein [Melissococcus plutonius]MCV2500902.1 DUF441 domain-containing protein [Melissococcus plutonius]MCV2504270.1 DUF441 domain-containing protein [Melissococcus plutonius]MCV2506792.1 DUF441 domain-containing protein [Melissococcus plutonius]MCV2518883.1 DUF441 domain-containing protein [Melissococcus plutonius]